MKGNNLTLRTYSAGHIAVPTIILAAITATAAALVSGCEISKPQRIREPPPAASRSTPPTTTTRPQTKRRDSGAKTDSNGDPITPPRWFKRELRRIEAGLDESQKPPEQRGRRAKRGSGSRFAKKEEYDQ